MIRRLLARLRRKRIGAFVSVTARWQPTDSHRAAQERLRRTLEEPSPEWESFLRVPDEGDW